MTPNHPPDRRARATYTCDLDRGLPVGETVVSVYDAEGNFLGVVGSKGRLGPQDGGGGAAAADVPPA
jgi:hypothetical protein